MKLFLIISALALTSCETIDWRAAGAAAANAAAPIVLEGLNKPGLAAKQPRQVQP